MADKQAHDSFRTDPNTHKSYSNRKGVVNIVSRRTILRSLGGSTVFLAGCTSSDAGSEQYTPTTKSEQLPCTNTPPGEDINAYDEIYCEGTETEEGSYITSDRKTATLPRDTVTFELVNEGRDLGSYNLCWWGLYKETNDGWKELENPFGGLLQAPPVGESVKLPLHVGIKTQTESGCDDPYGPVELTPGNYLFGIHVNGIDDSEGGSPQFLFLGKFEVIAPEA